METSVRIQEATSRDYGALAEVMFDAVRNGPSKYTELQRRAWVPRPRGGVSWSGRLGAQRIFVAMRAAEYLGFMSLAGEGYIDFAYVRPSAQGTGVFGLLFDAVEELAIEKCEPVLWVHASLMAQPAFAAKGFTVRLRETVEIGNQRLERFEMEKRLPQI